MSTNLKEWLLRTIAELEEERDATPGAVNEDAAMALAAMKLALASLEADGAAECQHDWSFGGLNKLQSQKQCVKCGRVELVAPPAPVVPDELLSAMEEVLRISDRDHDAWHKVKAGIVSCRAAMLQGADDNSPVIPDGWVACSERMPGPSTGVIVAAPWQSAPGGYAMKWATNCPGHPDADTEGWIIPGASWSPTHWMPLPAAPQQEVK